MSKTLAGRAQSAPAGENVAGKVEGESLSRIRQALEKQVEGKQEILMIRFSKINDDEISGFLKTRNRENKVFLTDFAAKTTSRGTIEYLKIGEKKVRIVKTKEHSEVPEPHPARAETLKP